MRARDRQSVRRSIEASTSARSSWWISVTTAVALSVTGCSKETSIRQELAIGQQCSGADDTGCGVGAVCVLGFCRSGCTTDAECPQDSLCVGDRAPFGCTLPAELACSSSQPCDAPLRCGLDGKCRLPCETSPDCPRNELQCVARTCVNEVIATACEERVPGATSTIKCNVLPTGTEACNVVAFGAAAVDCDRCVQMQFSQEGDYAAFCFAGSPEPQTGLYGGRCRGCEALATECALDFECLACGLSSCVGNARLDALRACYEEQCTAAALEDPAPYCGCMAESCPGISFPTSCEATWAAASVEKRDCWRSHCPVPGLGTQPPNICGYASDPGCTL